MTALRLLADDLTGALDTAAAFCGARGPVAVYLDPPAALAGDAALDLACREASEAAAVAAVLRAAPLLQGAGLAYFKIDSLLRGHWAAMLAALWRTGAFRTWVLAPAFPAQGRVTVRGRQHARDGAGVLRELPGDPLAALAAHGLAGTDGVALCDAASDADLAAIAARPWAAPVLWCGAAGLAAALAGAGAPRAGPLVRPVFLVVGSCHPVALAQFDHLRQAAGLVPLRLRGDARDAAAVGARLAATGVCLATAEIAPGTAPAEAALRIDACLRRLLPALPPPATLVVVGGETLRAAVRALGAVRLEARGEMEAGVPDARLCGGAWDGVRLVAKSGAFGSAGLLADLLAR